jgi:hypothetical protein
METIYKICVRCGDRKSTDNFYTRSGCKNPTKSGHYISECKDCMKQRSTNYVPLPASTPRTVSEILAIDYLTSMGIPTLPGKAVSASWVDVVAFGCVRIEVKYSRLRFSHGAEQFRFTSTPMQMKRGYLGDLIMLICEYPDDRRTFHIFKSDHPVFYIHGHIKTGFTFTPGAMVAKKHGDTRIVMTQPLMDETEDNLSLIYDALNMFSEHLRKQSD